MPQGRDVRTYRVRQLPSHVSKESLRTLLVNSCEALGSEDDIVVYSLASSLVPFETPRTKTATIIFKSLPSIFDNDETEWTLVTRDSQPNIIIDVHFLGFTALNDVDSDFHVLDGLASHPFGSWAERSVNSNFMWLRDRLPWGFKEVRSIIYGYDTRLLRSQSFQSVEDVALSLLAQLKFIGRALKSAKPVVFLAHSLGGIVLKSTLLEMANGGDAGEFMLSLVRGVILFGVPNKGMEISHWLPMVYGQPNEAIVQLLSPSSPFLVDLDQRFSGISSIRNLRLVSFYETEYSKTAELNASTGRWEMSGPFKILVGKESAIQCGSDKSDILPINRSHSEMVKFREGSEDYNLVARYIHEFIKPLSEFGSPNPFTAIQRFGNNTSHSIPNNPRISNADKDLEDRLLYSLDIKDTRYRFHKIEDSYGPTFKWIWTDPDAAFSSWLTDDRGIYWIGGKPGSGKSTLMKYIFKNYMDYGMPSKADTERVHLHAGFFFHDRGSHIQKSFEGLLNSMLHQILSSERRLIEEVKHVYARLAKKEWQIWPVEALEEALDCIVKQTSFPVNLYLFLDALDEYGGRPDFIVSFIKRITQHSSRALTRVKICFSSRLWNIFIDEFNTCPGFRIHEKTQKDILAYIEGKFNDSRSMAELQGREGDTNRLGIQGLKSQLLEKAEGVFLWLMLVVEDLLEACTEGATVSELLDGLALFPKELEALYVHLVHRIPKKYRIEAYAMLEIILRADQPVEEEDFWLAVACAPCQTLEGCFGNLTMRSFPPSNERSSLRVEEGVQKINPVDLIGSKDQRQRRLKSRCGGLIEMFDTRGPRDILLQFMHQTVKDFVSKPGFRQLITGEDNDLAENGYSFLAKYGIAQLAKARRFRVVGYPFIPSWFAYLHYGSRSESTTGRNQAHIIEAAVDAFSSPKYPNEPYALYDSPMAFGVVANLQLYIDDALRKNPQKFEGLMGHSWLNIFTFLHIAVAATSKPMRCISKRELGPFDNHATSKVKLDDLSDMVNLLLEHGANRDALYRGMTPFQMLFSDEFEGYAGGENILPQRVINMAQVFLQRGQDPNTTIPGKTFSGASRMRIKALHVADSSLAQIHLDHGADVNALDQNGDTALDIAFGGSGNLWEKQQPEIPAEGYKLILLLLNHGGCVSGISRRKHESFLKAISIAYPLQTIDPRMIEPPRLATWNQMKMSQPVHPERQNDYYACV